jgi:hypothetical protein
LELKLIFAKNCLINLHLNASFYVQQSNKLFLILTG